MFRCHLQKPVNKSLNIIRLKTFRPDDEARNRRTTINAAYTATMSFVLSDAIAIMWRCHSVDLSSRLLKYYRDLSKLPVINWQLTFTFVDSVESFARDARDARGCNTPRWIALSKIMQQNQLNGDMTFCFVFIRMKRHKFNENSSYLSNGSNF